MFIGRAKGDGYHQELPCQSPMACFFVVCIKRANGGSYNSFPDCFAAQADCLTMARDEL